ncbi:BrnT family toxin [Patescibacteria group bacterium]|nr:BrnT family toxin [Patescibacteria group bacterium]
MAKLPVPLAFDWDRENIDKNWKRHKVHFKEAEEVFFNKPSLVFPDKKHSTVEKRFQALGTTNGQKRLSVFFTIRNNKIRIISARNQSKKERKRYAK